MSTHADANFSSADFSALTASRRSTRAYTDQQIPQDILDAILKDATTAPSWSNTRAFRVALATGERADRLREEYVRRFGLRVKMCVWLGVSRGLDLAFLNDD